MGNGSFPIEEEQRSQIPVAATTKMASQGLRVLGLAYKPLREIPPEASEDTSENELVYSLRVC
ncbi:hypothetical protein U9R62_03815 [Cylindrospermopsis raciborskii DSH]|uniref:hypothetical protein n=1 Tax=Cylindrospermopsis raciborskii TaxID=77022 RepID=UPI002ED975DE